MSRSNPINPSFSPDLKETFVISCYNTAHVTNGWVDNVSMTRVFDLTSEGEQQRTLTFSEGVNGWTSFKSFKPENGVSLSKKYFTMKNGGLFQHYVPMAYDTINSVWMESTEEEAENYNIFYGDGPIGPFGGYISSIKTVLNNEPSTVKTFNTLNYEGSQAYVITPLYAEDITTDNAEAFNKGDINGWNCSEIKTDMDKGSVVEFIRKEGKWFNYIKGETVNINQAPDSSRFSVQGVGEVFDVTIESVEIQPPGVNQLVTTMQGGVSPTFISATSGGSVSATQGSATSLTSTSSTYNTNINPPA